MLVVDRVDADAADDMRQGRAGDPLTHKQQDAISAAIQHLSPVRFISDRSEFIQKDSFMPVIPGSVIITLGPVDFDRKGATVGANLWCGGECGLWLTGVPPGGRTLPQRARLMSENGRSAWGRSPVGRESTETQVLG